MLLTAPTGVAASTSKGWQCTRHIYLERQSLTPSHSHRTSWTKLSNLQLIIDEISMVGSKMLLQIHKRLQQLKGKGDYTTFGDVSILAVVDYYQLWPVTQPHIFAQVRDAYAWLHKSGFLWIDEFKMIELDEIMRQGEICPTFVSSLHCHLYWRCWNQELSNTIILTTLMMPSMCTLTWTINCKSLVQGRIMIV